MDELVSLLPPHYVISTVLQDRLVHLQLFKHLRNNPHARVGSHWEHHTDRTGKQALRLHLLFEDQAGSLAAVAGALSKAGVNILGGRLLHEHRLRARHLLPLRAVAERGRLCRRVHTRGARPLCWLASPPPAPPRPPALSRTTDPASHRADIHASCARGLLGLA